MSIAQTLQIFPLALGYTWVDSDLCTLVNIEDLIIIGPPVVGECRMVAEAEPFELLFNVSTAAWLIKDKELLA